MASRSFPIHPPAELIGQAEVPLPAPFKKRGAGRIGRLLTLLLACLVSLVGFNQSASAAGQGTKVPPAEGPLAAKNEAGSAAADKSGSGADLNRPVRDKWALVVGISKFARPELNLKNADKDAQDFYDFLVNDAHFARDHVRLLLNESATEKRIISELGNKWLPHVAGPDDLAVIYMSTHGSPSEMDMQGVNYIVAHDTDPDDLFTTGINMQQLAGIIKSRVHCDRIVIILDACHSGATRTATKGLVRRANIDAEQVALGTGQLVIASSLPDQSSWEYQKRPNGVFTACLLEALRSKGSNTTLGEAFTRMKDNVQETVMRERGVLQTPVLKSVWKGNDLALAVKPANPQPALPESELPLPAPERSVPPQPAQPGTYKTPLGQVPAAPDLVSSVGKLPDRVAILPFANCADLEVGTVDFDGLAELLEEMVRVRLNGELGERLLSPYAIGAALGKSNLGGGLWTKEVRMAMGRAFNARYIVKVNIEDATFDQAGACEFCVNLIVSSAENGEYIFTRHVRGQGLSCQGDTATRLKYLKAQVLPSCAGNLSRLILGSTSQGAPTQTPEAR